MLTTMPHRYLPYYRTSSPSSSTDLASEAESVSSRDSCSCERLKSMNISEKVSHFPVLEYGIMLINSPPALSKRQDYLPSLP